jgi:hypothetical protein
MPRPFYRSLLFYLGLPGLIFLLWAWADSMRYDSSVQARVQIDTPGNMILLRQHLRNCDSWIWIEWLEPADPDHTAITRKGKWFVRETRPGTRWFHPISQLTSSVSDQLTRRYLFIPHWLLILAYLALWSIALYWRHRRLKRASTLHSPAQPQTDL